MNEQVNNAIGGYEAETKPLDLQATIARLEELLVSRSKSMQVWIDYHNERADKAEAQVAEQQACIDKLVEVLERIAVNSSLTLTSYPSKNYGEYHAKEALAYVRERNLTE